MQRTSVESSQITSIGYDAKTRVLEIQFKRNGAIYSYASVPQSVYDELLTSSSVGKYFNANIKNRNNYVKQETRPDESSQTPA
jgi:hypothetical protein